MEQEGGFRVRRFRRYWLCFHWSLWVIILGISAAALCGSHPPTHDHDAAHPPLCIDAGSAVVPGTHPVVLFADRGTYPLPSKSLAPLTPDATLGSSLLLGFGLLAPPLSSLRGRKPLTPYRLSRAVLRL
jgi:hypothetical protein